MYNIIVIFIFKELIMKSALIMEGGAMRGMFTCGVIDVLMENGIKFDGAAGISAGAVFGINYKSNQIGRGIRYNKEYCNDKRYCSMKSLIKTGDLYNAEFCYETLPNELDKFDTEAFKNNPMEFYVGATNVDNGEIMFHKCLTGDKNDVMWTRASASMPIVSKVVKIVDYNLLDGGISCPVPYKYMMELGYDKNVIVLTQPKEYRKKKASFLIIMLLNKYKAIKAVMKNRHNLYNSQMDEIEKLENEGKALVIRPKASLNIGKSEKDKNKLEEVYQLGREACLLKLDEIKNYLND